MIGIRLLYIFMVSIQLLHLFTTIISSPLFLQSPIKYELFFDFIGIVIKQFIPETWKEFIVIFCACSIYAYQHHVHILEIEEIRKMSAEYGYGFCIRNNPMRKDLSHESCNFLNLQNLVYLFFKLLIDRFLVAHINKDLIPTEMLQLFACSSSLGKKGQALD